MTGGGAPQRQTGSRPTATAPSASSAQLSVVFISQNTDLLELRPPANLPPRGWVGGQRSLHRHWNGRKAAAKISAVKCRTSVSKSSKMSESFFQLPRKMEFFFCNKSFCAAAGTEQVNQQPQRLQGAEGKKVHCSIDPEPHGALSASTMENFTHYTETKTAANQ